MSDLSPEARELFAAAREAYSPDERRLAKVTASLGAQVGLTLAAPAGAAAAAGKAGGAHGIAWLSTTKLVGVGLVLGVAGAVGLVATRFTTVVDDAPTAHSSPVAAHREVVASPPVRDPAPPPAATAKATPALAAVPAPAASSNPPSSTKTPDPRAAAVEHVAPRGRSIQEPTEATKVFLEETPDERVVTPSPTLSPTPSPALSPTPSPTLSPTPSPRQERVASPAPRPVQVPTRDTLAQEVALVRAARNALDSGNASKALTLLNEHATAFPHGTLEPEQLAIRVLSLCAVGRTAEARAAAARLERLSPHSPHLERIRSSCAAPSSQ